MIHKTEKFDDQGNKIVSSAVVIMSKRKLLIGEELFLDYGAGFYIPGKPAIEDFMEDLKNKEEKTAWEKSVYSKYTCFYK